MAYLGILISVAALLLLAAISFLIMLILRLPAYFRDRGMARLAKEFGMKYDVRHGFFFVTGKDKNFITGILGGHQITIYDSVVVGPLMNTGRQVKVLIDGTERPIFGIDWFRYGAPLTPVSSVEKFLEKVKSGQVSL